MLLDAGDRCGMGEGRRGRRLSRRRPARWSWVKPVGSKDLAKRCRHLAREKMIDEPGSREGEVGRCGVCEGDTAGAEGGSRRLSGIGTGTESSYCCIRVDLPQMV